MSDTDAASAREREVTALPQRVLVGTDGSPTATLAVRRAATLAKVFGAEMRGCYNGMSTYLGNTTGDIWGCIGSWYSGAWHDGGAQTYIGWVQNALNNKAWLNWAG